MKRRLLLLAALLLLVGAGCAPKPRRVQARALFLKGAVQAVAPQGAARTLVPEEALEAGSRLSVPAGAFAAVSLVPGVAALADAQSELALDSLEMEKSGPVVEERRARVTLLGGTVRFSVGSPLDRRIALEVLAANGVTLKAEPGSLFSVSARGPRSVRVTCSRGAVGYSPGGGAPGSWILAGHFQEVGAEAAPGPPRPIFDDSAARGEAADLFDAKAALDALQQRQRNLTPFRP